MVLEKKKHITVKCHIYIIYTETAPHKTTFRKVTTLKVPYTIKLVDFIHCAPLLSTVKQATAVTINWIK